MDKIANVKVSVIIPTYNRASLIGITLDSFCKQNYPKELYEVIVVDNNSTDNTFEVVNAYTIKYDNIKYIKESRAGATFARHNGAKNAFSEYLIFADDDGIFNESCIEEILKIYNSNVEVGAVGGKIEILWDNPPPIWVVEHERFLGKLDYGSEILIAKKLYINGGLFSIKKSVLYELKGFNPDLIGEYLVGDGDTGLCNKIHKSKYYIGWTPHAKMQHMQFVNKNATIEDIGRRYYNHGLCLSYAFYKTNNYKLNKSVLKYFMESLYKFSKQLIKHYILNNQNNNDVFYLMSRKGHLVFFLNCLSKEYRLSCKREDWF